MGCNKIHCSSENCSCLPWADEKSSVTIKGRHWEIWGLFIATALSAAIVASSISVAIKRRDFQSFCETRVPFYIEGFDGRYQCWRIK